MAQSLLSRREALGLLAVAPLLAGTDVGAAAVSRIGTLIADAQPHDSIAARIDTISRALLGARYEAHTLIGGPDKPEVFVLRDDAFDCVTYCEVVWAAALARNTAEFAPALRQIRYHNGEVSWRERNHYFADWCARNIENKLCAPVSVEGMETIKKASNTERALGPRQWTLDVIPQAALLASAERFRTGDIVGFISRRANLDYSHTGFVAFGNNRELLLRHASSTRYRVIDEPMHRFIATNGVRYVTVVRPLERATVPNTSKNQPT